ncbi:glutathione S-transferase family protein [Leptolyngbya sp. FACHB-261]|uniref:glutathione S-transferase family protein n=1 Tax=Leptolyngbya sp. FACHB-261 TaxID=2692806 RepID=UPI001681E803|nr:glutathione S-transferase N-terminal domain-containing protein [Leptolyngbya sp. FACHB-261]MBD2103175.1 glutathione S-transferase family protein [Leptolyngbya sp. FACHB-261]
MTRTLYYAQRSPYARKVRIVLAEKALACDLKETDIVNKPAELLNLSPIGRVPVLVDEDGTSLWDSTLIVEYLDETYPAPRFYPEESRLRLRCRQWEDLADTLGDTAVALWQQKRKGNAADPAEVAKSQAMLDRLLPALERQLNSAACLLGDAWTAADVAAVSALGYYSLRFGQDWQQRYPRVGQWYETLHQRESVRSTVPQA